MQVEGDGEPLFARHGAITFDLRCQCVLRIHDSNLAERGRCGNTAERESRRDRSTPKRIRGRQSTLRHGSTNTPHPNPLPRGERQGRGQINLEKNSEQALNVHRGRETTETFRQVPQSCGIPSYDGTQSDGLEDNGGRRQPSRLPYKSEGARRQSPGLGTVDAAKWRHAVATGVTGGKAHVSPGDTFYLTHCAGGAKMGGR